MYRATSNTARSRSAVAATQSGRRHEANGSERPEVVKPREFFGLLLGLSHLSTLVLFRSDADLLNVVLFHSEGVLVFPHLWRLAFSTDKIRPPLGGHDTDAWVRNLARLPRLSSLSVEQSAESSPLPPMRPPLPLFMTLTRLDLEGAQLGESDAPTLVDLAPHLVELRLADTLSAPACASILRMAPTGLRTLHLLSPLGRQVDPRPGCILDDVLPRFKHLEDLYLSAHSFTPARLAPCLASLPSLRTLRFGWASQPTDDLLAALFVDPKSPHRLRHLRTLELDHVWDFRGDTIEHRAWKFPAGATSGLDGLDDSWHPARWPAGCSADGTKTAVAAARAAGIEVDGIGVHAASWDEAYERERSIRLIAWAVETGDYEEAREELGDLTVELCMAYAALGLLKCSSRRT